MQLFYQETLKLLEQTENALLVQRKDSDTTARVADEDYDKKDDECDEGIELTVKERQEFVHKFSKIVYDHIP